MNENCPPFAGSAKDYAQEHFNQHGRAEGMVHGRHVKKDGKPDPKSNFPQGSRREKAHESYKESTNARNTTHDDYQKSLAREKIQFESIPNKEKKTYFTHISNGLLPRQHEDLARRAERWDDNVYEQVKLCLLCGEIYAILGLGQRMVDLI